MKFQVGKIFLKNFFLMVILPGFFLMALNQSSFNLSIINKTILFTLSITSIIYFIAYIGHKSLLKYLELINRSITSAKEGDLTQKVEIKKTNICSSIAENLNSMLNAMNKRQAELKNYQEELRSKKENLEAIFNSSTDGLMTLSQDLKIISVNPTITQWFGVSSERIVGNHFNEFVKCNCHLKMSDIDCNDPSACPIAAYWPEEMPKEAHIINAKDNHTRFVALNCSPIHGLTKSKETFVAILMDITQLKELDKVKETFVATLTHDLRVPLLAENLTLKYMIKGSYGILTDNQKIAAENMLNSNQDQLKLVNTLLDVYKYESGRLELYKEKVNIKSLVDECLSELSPLVEKSNHTVISNIKEEFPIINADRNELKRVLMNLISNAITYTSENGKIKIESEQNDSNTVIKIIDNGRGIPENELKNIFDRYYTGAKKFRKVGTGLGLYLSKQIINAHNGKIWVESIPGEGSTFFFSLPINTEGTSNE
jgi:signal transduction histidine kinase